MLSSRERPLEDELRLAPVLPHADAANQCQWSSIIWVKNAAVESRGGQAARDRLRPACNCAARRRESVRPDQKCGSDSHRHLAVARRSLRRDPSKFGGLAHFLIIGMNEFGEAIRRHLLGGGEFRAHFAQLVSCRSTGKSSSDCFLQLSDDRSRRAYGCKYSNIALSGEVLHAPLDKGGDVGRELGAAARRDRNDVGLVAFVQRQCGGKFRHCCLNTASD